MSSHDLESWADHVWFSLETVSQIQYSSFSILACHRPALFPTFPVSLLHLNKGKCHKKNLKKKKHSFGSAAAASISAVTLWSKEMSRPLHYLIGHTIQIPKYSLICHIILLLLTVPLWFMDNDTFELITVKEKHFFCCIFVVLCCFP